ncbi:hypothetical protein DPMN_002945 [Dreissena polymorpha]|uniref:Uncharacterized protein n=1 Tax=Dreissena polymorpha TaxID=45954 RepID=A0A9D4RS77_DREPO|nr:hypothetical protein DPMN_002945 [Dreissena polymorpha]
MADHENLADTYFGNLDSEGEFEGFEEADLVANNERRCPEFEADNFKNDRDYPNEIQMNWSYEVREPLGRPFTGDSGLKVEVDQDATPLEYFNLFLNNTDMNNIAFETNRY